MRKDRTDFEKDVFNALMERKPLNVRIFQLEPLLDGCGMGIYKSVVYGRIVRESHETVAALVRGEHIYYTDCGMALDYIGLIAYTHILEGYIGHETMRDLLEYAKARNSIAQTGDNFISFIRKMSVRELIKPLEPTFYPEQIDTIRYWRIAELVGRIPLVRLWYGTKRRARRFSIMLRLKVHDIWCGQI